MRIVALSLLLLAGTWNLQAIPQEELKAMMRQNLDSIENTFKVFYAPASWKERYCGWNLRAEIDKVRKVVEAASPIGIKDYQAALAGFFRSTRDSHVGVYFGRTESASLPLVIKGVKGRYFLADINRG